MAAREKRGAIVMEADEVNTLIHSYLIDSGFIHSAFTFRNEAKLDKSPYANVLIRRNELPDLLAKALLYNEVEAHHKQPPGSCNQPFRLIGGHVCKNDPNSNIEAVALGGTFVRQPQKLSKPREEDVEMAESGGNVSRSSGPSNVKQLYLMGEHREAIFHVAWNPAHPNWVASAGNDGGVVIWDVNFPTASQALPPYKIIARLPAMPEGSIKVEIGSLQWSQDGNYLAFAAEGMIRVWNASTAQFVFTENLHTSPTCLRFSSNSEYLVGGSMDSRCSLIDTKTWKVVRQYAHHAGPILDVIWYSNQFFFTCSADQVIQLAIVDNNHVFRIFRGHTADVNRLALSSNRKCLLSCSDDHTARVWKMDAPRRQLREGVMIAEDGSVGGGTGEGCIHVLRGHTAGVQYVKWVPTHSGIDETETTAISLSLDSTLRVWDIKTGNCLHVLSEGNLPLFNFTFSPEFKYMAVCSQDKSIVFYDVETWAKVCVWEETGWGLGAYDLAWHKDGLKLSVALVKRAIVILDLTLLPGLSLWVTDH